MVAVHGYGANPNETRGKNSNSLLHTAASTGNYGFASVLLECNAHASSKNRFQATPLHFCARSGQVYLAALLIEHKADTDTLDSKGRTPLNLAIEKENQALVDILTKAGTGSTGATEISLVAELNKWDLKKYSF